MVEERDRERGYPPVVDVFEGLGTLCWEKGSEKPGPCGPGDVFAGGETCTDPLQLGLPGVVFKIPFSADAESGVRGLPDGTYLGDLELEFSPRLDWYEYSDPDPELLALSFRGAEPGLADALPESELIGPGVWYGGWGQSSYT